MLEFPSVSWFQEVADRVNKSDTFKRLGACDVKMGVQVGDEYYEVPFEAYQVAKPAQIDEQRAHELDFVLVQSPEEWKAMLEHIRANGHAEHQFRLSTIHLNSKGQFARANDEQRQQGFERYNEILQEYFDMAGEVETSFRI